MASELSPWRLIGVAFLGAIALEAVLLFSIGVAGTFSVRQIPSHVAALTVGTIGGWLYELFRELHSTTKASLQQLTALSASVEALTGKISYQDKALSMLVSCPRHNEALTALIKASMSDNFKNIPFVGVAEYFDLLELAIAHSDGYQGVQRRPLRWYRERSAASYLEDLRERRMRYKTRLIIVNDDDVPAMEEDLKDKELLKFYWSHTGSVDTYWISVSDFEANLPGHPVPRDFALYDRMLLIAYDEPRQILSFDIAREGSPERKLFEIHQQHVLHKTSVFKKVPTDIAAAES